MYTYDIMDSTISTEIASEKKLILKRERERERERERVETFLNKLRTLINERNY